MHMPENDDVILENTICIHFQIDIGLAFYHVSSKLEIHMISASKLRRANMHNDQSDPFAKVRVFHTGPSSSSELKPAPDGNLKQRLFGQP
jgi:hypothetical protein